MSDWWQTFFDDDYLALWGGGAGERERTEGEVDALWSLCGLHAGARVLDAPCGYGRLSRPLAARGACVVGVDQSAALLAAAERERAGLGDDRLRYRQHDLRAPLDDTGFDVALNIYSSLGYGSEDDDLAILTTLRRALVPGGRLFVDSAHRDNVAIHFSRGVKPAERLPDGTLVVEEPQFDAVAGRVSTCWYWWGPRGSGEKRASIRIYCITELAALLARAGFRLVSAHRGCSTEPFRIGPDAAWRVGLVCLAV